MKFTKQEAIKALEAKIPAKDKELDLSRTISEAVDNSFELIGEDSEMELEDFVGKVFKQVKTSIGLTHSENSKVAQKMQKQLDELQAKIDDKKHPNDGDGDEDDPKTKALLERIAKMEERLATSDKEKTVAEKRRQLTDKMKESITDNDWIEAYLAEISVTEDTDVEAKAKDYVAFYNKTHTKGGKMTPRSTDNNDDNDSKHVKDAVAAAARIKKQMYGNSQVKTETK